MNTAFLESLASHPLVAIIGWTLVHFVWQAAIVGAIAAISLGMMRKSTASVRYLAACAGLLLMAAAPVGTFAYLVSTTDSESSKSKQDVAVIDSSTPGSIQPLPVSTGGNVGAEDVGDVASMTERKSWSSGPASKGSDGSGINKEQAGASGWLVQLRGYSAEMQSWLPWFVAIWITGVISLAMRLLIGLRRVWRWKNEGTEIAGGDLADAVSRLSTRMKLRRKVRLLETARDTVPAVIGWIRPAILVPASMLNGLTTSEMESIVAHELAHIRRYDYLVNLLQAIVETLLFYHPVVWWLSERIRVERENCCDDIAIKVCGNRLAFANALARMEEIRCRGERLSMAATGGSLISRIRRIVGAEPVCAGPWWPAGIIVMGSLGVLAGGLWITAEAHEHSKSFEKAPSETAEANSNGDEESEFNLKKTQTVLTDSRTGVEQHVIDDIKLVTRIEAESVTSSLAMKYSNVLVYSFIPARIANKLNAVVWGEIDFGESPPHANDPVAKIIEWNDDGAAPFGLGSTPHVGPSGKTIHVHELTGPVDADTKIVPYFDEAIWVPGHLASYGLNQTNQHTFQVVCIDKVRLGVGPEFGSVLALVLDDENSDFGLLGRDWLQRVRGTNGEGLWFQATDGSLVFTAGPAPVNKEVAQDETEAVPAGAGDENVHDQEDAPDLNFQTVEKDKGRVRRIVIEAFGHGRSATELVRHFSATDRDISKFRAGVSTTNMETLVSAVETNYLIGNAIEAQEIYFNLPEGSGTRAEFSGNEVEIFAGEKSTTVVITNGRLELIDAGGVIRAWASPDGGAEQLVVECKQDLGEVVMLMKTRRIEPSPEYPNPPVQAVMNTETGAPKDEKDPPHRGIRYEIQQGEDDSKPFIRMKMKWRYELNRLAEEAVAESGMTLEELIFGNDEEEPNPSLDFKPLTMEIPENTGPVPIDEMTPEERLEQEMTSLVPGSLLSSPTPPAVVGQPGKPEPGLASAQDDTDGWGSLAFGSGLRSRLTLLTEQPVMGKPILFKLEVKNFGDKPTAFDLQKYAPFRVLKVENDDFSPAAPFIGNDRQTASEKITLQPGESKLLWKDIDVTELYLLTQEKDYFIFAEGGEWALQAYWQDSNRVKVNLAPGELPPLQRVVAGLIPNLPPDWKLSTGFGAIFLSHSPAKLKDDVKSIQLVFLDEAGVKKLMESERRPLEMSLGLGKTVLGDAFLIAPAEAANLWRDCADTIKQSLTTIRVENL